MSVDGTVKTPAPSEGVRMAKVYFRGPNVRVTFNSTTPSASVGVPFYDGYEEWFSIEELSKMKLTREGASNGEAHFVYYN